MTEQGWNADVLIAGAGYVGLSLAVALKQSDPDLTVIVADPRHESVPDKTADSDARASAVAASARRLLEVVGVFDALKPHAQPILDMVVTDSRTGDAVRPVFLSFDGEVAPGEAFAHMVPNAELVRALHARAVELGVIFEMPCRISGFATKKSGMHVDRADNGSSFHVGLLVAADGVRSSLRTLSGIRTVSWKYRQKAIVTTLAHTEPHNGRAEEHFLPAGPLALLPLTGNRSSLVWTEEPHRADQLVKEDETLFLMDLESRTGFHLGEFSLAGPRQAYPLGLMLVREFVGPRFALIGDAAHGIHPIAGQGLNMGFRDVAALAETIVETRRLGLDVGSPDCLARYQQWRRFDTWQMGAVTDGLNRLFSNDNPLVRGVRDFGLGLVDRMPAMKTAFMKEAAGITGEPPKLMRGEPI
ncbi:MAG: ubiquinone biosynthesis hydroxylase [Pseudomonadota bacterium]